MNCKPGILAVIVRSEMGNEGKILTCLASHPPGYDNSDPRLGVMWETDRHDIAYETCLGDKGFSSSFPDSGLYPIRDQPGNEDFVVESRKTLPRKKPVTGPVTIDARGEVVR